MRLTVHSDFALRLLMYLALSDGRLATIADVADNIEYIRKLAGVDHVGIGSDFDGIPTSPDGLSSVADYPALFVELARQGWSDQDLAKLADPAAEKAATQPAK